MPSTRISCTEKSRGTVAGSASGLLNIHSLLLFGAGAHLKTALTCFFVSIGNRYGHMTNFWPTRYKQKFLHWTSGKVLKMDADNCHRPFSLFYCCLSTYLLLRLGPDGWRSNSSLRLQRHLEDAQESRVERKKTPGSFMPSVVSILTLNYLPLDFFYM